MTSQADANKAAREEAQARAREAIRKSNEARAKRIEELKDTIKDLNDEKTKLDKKIKDLEKNDAETLQQIATLDPDDPFNTALLASLRLRRINNKKGIDKYKASRITIVEKIKKKRTELSKVVAGAGGNVSTPNATPSSTDNTNSRVQETNNGGGADDWKKGWNYNAPLVKSAYFSSVSGIASSLQGKGVGEKYIDQGSFTDALNAWTNGQGGRGTIQMDRKARTAILEAQGKDTGIEDKKMYGFKFLYNPKDVAMAWGIMDQMDPEFVASGQDAFSAISAGLMASSVSITIILNRIEDDNYLDSDGNFLHTNPYPIAVPLEDRKEIWEKGTMYDLEYLFRTLNGPRAKFTSDLNGSTSDRGWLRPSVVELHLGARMRYRVRVQNLQVAHTIFNERMVPIFTSVKLDLGRFNDGPGHSVSQATADLATSTYGTGSGGYIGGTYYGPEEYNKLMKRG